MKNLLGNLTLIALLAVGTSVHAQMMGISSGGTTTLDAQTLQEQAEGKAVWDKLQSKTVTCSELKDDDFDVLADYFMGTMMGENHEAMNNAMKQRLGEDGEEQMHIAMGKRLSGCDTNAPLPAGSSYFTSMMSTGGGMMRDTEQPQQFDSWNEREYGRGHMMSYGGSHGFFGPLTGTATLVFLVLGSIFFWKGIKRQG